MDTVDTVGLPNKSSIATNREGVIEKRNISNDFRSRPQKMHEEIKEFYGKLSLCPMYELPYSVHILPTCCCCTKSSAEDKLAFK